MKKSPLIIVFSVLLAASACWLAYFCVDLVAITINFDKETKAREKVVIEQIKNIRTAEFLYKQVNGYYTDNFDSLTNFILKDSITLEKRIGSADDSVAVAQGKVKVEKFKMAVRDSLKRNAQPLTKEQIINLRYIPYAQEGTEFYLQAARLDDELKTPVFECRAPYKAFLYDLDKQELINLINECETVYEKYPGIQIGKIDERNNGEGNWGENN